MITPVFSITQDADFLTFVIRAPYAKIAETEIEYGDELFVFSSPPYYLRVHLPAHVIQDDTGSAQYNSDKGEFTVIVPKKTRGEAFPSLDMISELLRPQKQQLSARPVVEEIDNGEDSDEEEEDGDEYLSEQKMQDVAAGIRDEESCKYGYGFGWRRTGVLEQLRGEIGKVIDLVEPEVCAIEERAQHCEEFDKEKFDADRYLVDTLDQSDELSHIISTDFEANLDISEADREKLKDIPARKLPKLSPSDTRATSLSLIDLIYAWAYDQRVNEWEESCESGWTISRLSPTLMYLVKWNDAKQESTHMNAEPMFEGVLVGYLANNKKQGPSVVNRLEEIRLRGRKRDMIG